MSSGPQAMLAALVMAAYLPFGLLMDALLPRHRAVLVTLLTGFMFLPSVEYDLGGALNWNRFTAPIVVIGLGMAMRDYRKLSNFRLSAWDLAMVAFCLAPGLAAVSNGLRLYDAGSAVFYQTLRFAGPYIIGRVHFQSREHLADLVRFGVVASLIYAPLCLWEFRFSPQLHFILYGFYQHNFGQSVRGFLYRPVVFLQHGLMVAMWLAMSVVLALGLNFSGRLRLLRIPTLTIAAILMITLVASQSLGAVLLCGYAAIALAACRRSGSRWPIVGLALIPILWVFLRTSGILQAEAVTRLAEIVSTERSDSLGFRLANEDRLTGHVAQRPLFGWSTWGRGQTIELEYEQQMLILDSLWIIILSQMGWYGLAMLLLIHLVPVFGILSRAPPRTWRSDPDALLLGCLGVVIATSMVDNLFNSMINPYFLLFLGAATSLCLGWQERGWTPAVDDDRSSKPTLDSGPRILGA